MSRLSAAHFGYNHQDCVTAYAFAVLLLPRFECKRVAVDHKVVVNDRFDDLEITGPIRRRIQIKSHEVASRSLLLSDFTTNRISFRIDDAIASFINDRSPADEYRLFTSFDSPETDLNTFLEPMPQIPPLLPWLATQRYKLIPANIWPEESRPIWPHIESFSRDDFVAFCNRFVIELNCPRTSGDLRNPADLDQALLSLLRERIGVGSWPNNNRDLADAAAHLIQAASIARANSAAYDQQAVIETLALRIDYGRVEENFPVDEKRLVPQINSLRDISLTLVNNSYVAITGSPGTGKSWLLHQLASYLNSEGWQVLSHYCFIDLFDIERARRASVDTIFGSILAQLLEKNPSLAVDNIPRYAAGPHELETLLDAEVNANPEQRIVIIVDGLDHADRLPDNSQLGYATEIMHELAAMKIPRGVAIVIGSQPGKHLDSFLNLGIEYNVPRWSNEEIGMIVVRIGLDKILCEFGLGGECGRIEEVIINKAAGNPLYATYLTRTAITIAQHKCLESISDISEYLIAAPTFDQNLDTYYQWLFHSLARDTGVIWIGELLSLVDFPLSADEIKQIKPEFRHHVDDVLAHLAPVLIEEVTHGGVRIYHESFQRFMRIQLEADQDASIAIILKPVIEWLDDRGFFADLRTFRSILNLLKKAGRHKEVVSRIADDYVANAIAHGQPSDAVFSNLSVAADIAANYQWWPVLARLVELSRAAYHFYQWRLNDDGIAEQYGKTFSSLFGPRALTDRLLHNGICTFPPRSGLVLCKLCDSKGVIPPWSEYREAHDLEQRTENIAYSKESDTAIQNARLLGRFRIKGREQSIDECISWLSSSDDLPAHAGDIAWILGSLYGSGALIEVINVLPSGIRRSWVDLTLAQIHENQNEAKICAENALLDGLPPEGWRSCLKAGADSKKFPISVLNLGKLTAGVISPDIQFHEEILSRWLTVIELLGALGDEISLNQVELNIPADFWFHRWLRFCLVIIRPKSTQDEIVSALSELSQNIEVFEGKPRTCDLYELAQEIRDSFRQALSLLDEDHWKPALTSLKQISSQTSSWFQGYRSGPLPLDEMFDICLSVADTEGKCLDSSVIGTEMLAPEKRGGEYYDTHARDLLLLARIHLAAGESDLAKQAWMEACLYLSSYGERKDITVYELVDPLESLAQADPLRVRRCFFDVQPVVERILNHTDGRETNHAIHRWLDFAASTHPAGSLSYLAHYGIERIPSFGDLDHAIPIALAALEDKINPILLLAGWISVGSEARSSLPAVFLTCEKFFHADPDLGKIAWNVTLGCLDGDGFNPPDGLQTLVDEFAERTGLPALIIEETPPPSSQKRDDYLENHPIKNKGLDTATLPFFPTAASPIHIIHGVRVWRDSRDSHADVTSVTNAVGWRLMEMVDANNESLVEAILLQIARDLPPWDAENFFPNIADGLAFRGAIRLSALASTLAYTRTRDGWRSFAGPKSIKLFTRAIGFDPSIAWTTLADEVSGRVAKGGDYGVNVHLIELLLAGGRVHEAFDTWSSACRCVLYRVPYTGPEDEIDIPYEYENDKPAEMLTAVILTRINHCFIHEKRLAVAAAALIVQADPSSYGAAFKYLFTHKIPSSTLIALLQTMILYEPGPYLATHFVVDELRTIAASNLVSARTLSRRLLERAGIKIPVQPMISLPYTPDISKDRVSSLRKWIGERRINSVEEIWPEFGECVVKNLDVHLKSEELGRKMQRALNRLDANRKTRNSQVWLPSDEEVEFVVQVTGSTVRTAMAQYGVIDPNIEQTVGSRLLGNMDIANRLMFSRIVRPNFLPPLTSMRSGYTTTEPISVPCGEFVDWMILAYTETELLIGDDYDKTVVGEVNLYSGFQLETNWRLDNGLPLGYGHLKVWLEQLPPSSVHVPFHGPLVGISLARDAFGVIQLLSPHPILQVASQLIPTPFNHGLTLVDHDGNPAVVCRYWRQRIIDTPYMAGQEPRIQGIQLLARPDILNAVSGFTLERADYVTYVAIDHFDENQ